MSLRGGDDIRAEMLLKRQVGAEEGDQSGWWWARRECQDFHALSGICPFFFFLFSFSFFFFFLFPLLFPLVSHAHT